MLRGLRVAALALALILALGTVLGAGGCQKPVAPHVGATSTTEIGAPPAQSSGVDEHKFNEAWGCLKELIDATSMAAAARPALDAQVQKLRDALGDIPAGSLNADEQQVLADFDRVYWAYADGLALWKVLVETDADCEGIPIYRDGAPLLPRADDIVRLYSLPTTVSGGSPALTCVPEDSIEKLWKQAYAWSADELLPVFAR